MFLLWCSIIVIIPARIMGYVQWTPPSGNRSDLFCDDSCISNGKFDDWCCYCHCKSVWEMQREGALPLFVEYDNLFGSNNLLESLDQRYSRPVVLSAIHKDGYMSAFPRNMCEFSEIVELDFSGNFISEISDLSCLKSIERLLLRGNKIAYLYNTTFANNTKLREIDIAENNIKVLQPNAFVINGVTIFNVDVSSNDFKTIDITNIVIENGYCTISYDNSPVQEFTNLNDFKIDINKSYGGSGEISIINCSFSSLFNLTNIGITEPQLIRKCLDFSVKYDNIKLKCDCLLEPFLEVDEATLKNFMPALLKNNVSCLSPDYLTKYKVKDFILNPDLRDLFVCEHKFKCPDKCKCIEQPSQKHLIINCTDSNLKSLPEHVPWYANYSLILDGNFIEKIENREYLSRVSVLKISNNPPTSITDSAAGSLSENTKIIALNTKIQNIPKAFYHLRPSFMVLGYVFLDCTCDNIWVSDWINIREPNDNSTTILCRNRNNIDIKHLSRDDLDCLEDSNIKITIIALAVLCFLLTAALLLCTCCRPEMYILYREKLSCRGKIRFETKFDVTISLDENDTFQILWASRVLLPYLEQNYYTVYFAPRDEPAAKSIEDCVQYQAVQSRVYIFLVSKNSFFNKTKLFSNEIDAYDWIFHQQAFQFKRMWKLYKTDKFRKIIVVNFDNTKLSEVGNRNVKAFLRVREALNFTDRSGNILHKIKEKIGEPDTVCGLNSQGFDYKCDKNSRTVFRRRAFPNKAQI